MASSTEKHFLVDHLLADLKVRSARGGAITLSAQAVKFLLHLGSTAVLARLLAPTDFGLVAMVGAIVGFVGLFKDVGLSMATLQRPHITHAQVSTLFWINVAVSLMLTVVAVGIAPAVAWFYGEPRLSLIVVATASSFVFGGLAAQHTALLRRQMRFAALAGIDVVSIAVGIATGIALAWLGAGYWSLVAIGVAYAAIGMALCWLASGWRPSMPSRTSGVRTMLAYGSNLTGSSILQYINRNLDNVLIGWWWGAGPLGRYDKAYSLLMLPITQVNGPISAVAIPALCRLQNDWPRYRRYYCKAVSLMVFLGMPIVAFAYVAADKLVLLLLGPQWGDTVEIFRALAPAAFVGTFNVATGWVFVSLGFANRQLRLAAFNTVMIVAAMLVSLPYGPLGVARGFSVAVVALRLPHIMYCFWPTQLRLADLAGALATPLAASLGAGIGLTVWNRALPAPCDVLLISALVDGLVYVALYGSLCLATPKGRRLLWDFSELHWHLWASNGVTHDCHATTCH
jgi:PST family polysaccharide transporter